MILQCRILKEEYMCKNEEILDKLSVPQVCERGLETYREALVLGKASGSIPRCLRALGLLRPLPESPDILIPIPPGIAADLLARPHEQEIARRREAVTGIRSCVAPAQAVYQLFHAAAGAPIEAYAGRTVIRAAVETAVRECREELLTAQPGRADAPESPWRPVAPDPIPGVRRRTLCQHTVRSHGPSLAYLERLTTAGAEVRTVEEISDSLIICDRTVAFVPGDQAPSTSAVAIRHPGAVQHLARVFASMWDRAEPIGPLSAHERPPQLTDDVRRAVLRLMVDGHTDGAIAARLGMSARTVATHIKKTADGLGSRSRAQLAYLIARSGLLAQDGTGRGR